MRKITLIFLSIIIIIATFLRVWQLGEVPPSPDWDEAALGYNAYSILQTGKDEHGDFLPVVLRSFDDYKPALYTYLILPLLPILDLNLLSVRLPSVIFGLIAIIAVYILLKEVLKREDLALVSALLLAISPWHIQFSRVAFETNVGLTFNILMALFFVIGLRMKQLLPLSAIFAGLSFYTYQSEKIFTPLLLLALIVIYRQQLKKVMGKYLIISVITLFVVSLPMGYYILTNDQALQRAKATSILSASGDLFRKSALKVEADREKGNTIGLVLDNRRVEVIRAGISGYLSHYNLNWLFITGDIDRHHAPHMGLLYLFELPFLFIGIFSALLHRFYKMPTEGKQLLFAWFLLAPVPAAFTTDVPHAVRTMNFLPTFQIFIALGLLTVVSFIKTYKVLGIKYYVLSSILYAFVFILTTLNIIYYLNQYFIQQNYFTAKDWQYGYQEAVPYVESIRKDYKQVIVSDKVPLDQSYIFFLYYLKYSPEKYQQVRKEHHAFENYIFRPVKWQEDKNTEDVLYVGSDDEFPKEVTPLKTIYYPDGKPAIKIIGTK